MGGKTKPLLVLPDVNGCTGPKLPEVLGDMRTTLKTVLEFEEPWYTRTQVQGIKHQTSNMLHLVSKLQESNKYYIFKE